MTTKLKSVTVYFSADELAYLETEAAPYGYTIAQYIRRFLEFPVLSRGAPTGNINARKNPTKTVSKNVKKSVPNKSKASPKSVLRQGKKPSPKSQEKLFE